MRIWGLASLLAVLVVGSLQAFAVTAATATATNVELRRGDDVRKAAFRVNAGCYARAFNEKETLLIASMGQMMSGGYSISMQKAVENENSIIVDVVKSSPGPDDMVTMALTWPQDAAAIKKSDKPIIFSIVSRSGMRVSAPQLLYIPCQNFKGYSKTAGDFSAQTINDEKSWKVLWTKLDAEKVVPAIDFTKYTAVTVCLGGKINGKDLEISEITNGEGGAICVRYRLSDQAVKTTVNNAYAIAIIPVTKAKIIYEEAPAIQPIYGGADCIAAPAM